MKLYRGSAAGARQYVEADRSRADDYYLAEGTGIAQRFTVDADGHVIELAPMDGDRYEAWVAGVNPDTGVPRGRLRTDARAVRFCEVIVNGPKTWSIAAETHPEIAAAYEAAQDRAVVSITAWLGQHATARIGPRGGQVAVPVDRVEVAAVRHYTSRAGDPHRHIHLQINARVLAGGSWRGIDTVAIRDSSAAINGIGHAAVIADPRFRAALARHGFTVDADGEIEQLTAFIAPFSKRAAQITRQFGDYETQWRAENPGSEPGPGLRRAWDARAWASGRPDKNTAVPARVVQERWLTELEHLGYCPTDSTPAAYGPPVVGTPIGQIDRDQAAAQVIARVGSQRSAWNHADLRGEAELVLAGAGVIAEPAVWAELAEDVTARATATCLPLLERAGVPDHIRALTSAYVIAVEADINGRLAVRGAATTRDPTPDITVDAAPGAGPDTAPERARTRSESDLTLPADTRVTPGRVLDQCQAAAVDALTGGQALVVLEGAAGSGKTTTLAATGDILTTQGHRMVVVTPTLKAAKVAAAQTGAAASSAAWLAYQYGWRWHDTGTWTRLAVGQIDPHTGRPYPGVSDPAARLQGGDLVVIDEAGMLDQDTARALLVIADEAHARVAMLGDPHQLTAVGRGGVLQIAERWTDTLLTLDVIHRFMHTLDDRTDEVTGRASGRVVPDVEYAQLSLAMRAGHDPAAVFDALLASGHVQLHDSDDTRQALIAEQAVTDLAAGTVSAIVVDTREQARELNATIHTLHHTRTHHNADHDPSNDGDRDGIRAVQDAVACTRSGESIGLGDVVATRRNDRGLDVANRDTWTVTQVLDDGGLRVDGANGSRVLGAGYAREHVELAFVTTAHGVQGDTVQSATLLLSEHTTGASAYVAMTRGQYANTVHIVANSETDAREQWVDAFTRGKPDLGLVDARTGAAAAASQYATPRPLEQVLAELQAQWAIHADATEDIERLEPQLERAIEHHAKQQQYQVIKDWFTVIGDRERATRHAHKAAKSQLAPVQARVDTDATTIYAQLLADWNTDREAATRAAQVVRAGTGRFGRGKNDVADATRILQQWATRWEPVIGDVSAHVDVLTGTRGVLGYAIQQPSQDQMHTALQAHAQTLAESRHPEHRALLEAVAAAKRDHDAAFADYYRAQPQHQAARNAAAGLARDDYPERIAALQADLTEARDRLTQAEQRVTDLSQEPAAQAQPADTIATAHSGWKDARDTRRAEQHRADTIEANAACNAKTTAEAIARMKYASDHVDHNPRSGPGPGVRR
ncbi:MAG: relaxase domain-containing protein [Actinomycetota bacterium]|nr:relaxase domain-containing protein [Actinomycetota bacterium]